MSRVRKHLTAEQKAQIVRRHLAGKEPVSNLADEFGVQPSQIHWWVKQVLDQAEHAFNRIGRPTKEESAKSRQIERLEAKLVQKNEVIAELLEENVRAKKRALGGRLMPSAGSGSSERTLGSPRYARRGGGLRGALDAAQRAAGQAVAA